MANINFASLNIKEEKEVKTIEFNDIEISVIQYLPIDAKIKFIENVLRNSADENNFANPMKVAIFTGIETVENYTNIIFSKAEKENPSLLFDKLVTSQLLEDILDEIPSAEYSGLLSWLKETIDGYYKYKNSALGVIESAALDANALNFELDKIKEEITNTENFNTLKEIAEKLD